MKRFILAGTALAAVLAVAATRTASESSKRPKTLQEQSDAAYGVKETPLDLFYWRGEPSYGWGSRKLAGMEK